VRASLLLLLVLATGCGDDSSGLLWTVEQAESITSIRGTPVRVRQCRGLAGEDGRFSRFECLASARTAFDRFDTVGVFYVLQPLGEYEGPRSRHRLSNVRFVGGPGIP
jgi:hypothetical protein